MEIGKYFSSAIDILKLDEKAITKTSKDSDATGIATIFVLIGGAASGVGMLFWPGLVLNALGALVGFLIYIGILHLLARMFGGKGRYFELYRPVGVASAIYWVSLIPFAGPIIALIAAVWMVVVEIVSVRSVHKLTTGKSVLVVLIPAIVLAVLVIIGLVIAFILFMNWGLWMDDSIRKII